MAITNFVPEIWAAQLQSSLKANLVFGGVANRNYEGELVRAGDTVNITSVNAPVISDYTKNGALAGPATLTDTTRALTITEAKSFSFEIDDIDSRQAVSGGALMAEAAAEAAYALADLSDAYLAGVAEAGTLAGNKLAARYVSTSAEALQGIIDLMVVLNDSSVPSNGRYVIVPSWYYALLVASPSFLDASQAASSTALRNGTVGHAFGFDVLVSTNTVTADTDTDNVLQAGYPGAVTFAQNIAKVEAFRPEASFSDALKGLSVYGALVTRPSGLATLTASTYAI
jgi:hypothetical protein